MTAQEKAKELVDSMYNCDKSTPNEAMAMLYPHAKQCALIAAENVRTEMVKLKRYELAIYWRDVKQEIQSL